MRTLLAAFLALTLAPGLAWGQGQVHGGTVLGRERGDTLGPPYEVPFRQVTAGSFPLDDYGAKGDGVTDDGPALLAAIAAASQAGGGTVQLGPKAYLINTALDLSAYRDVTVQGNIAAVGSDTYILIAGDYVARPYALILNPAISINLGAHQAFRGVNFVRKGMVKPTSLHSFQAEIDAFAGTALKCLLKHDVRFESVTIVGFAQPLETSCDRMTLTDVTVDTANGKGIWGTACYDYCHWTRVEAWPFVHAPDHEIMEMTVTGAANNGAGLIRITVGSAPVEALVTGDTVAVGNVAGVPNATGRFKITVVNPTTFDLQASTWGGAYTSGGDALWKPVRKGAGMTLQNGIYNLHSYLNFGNDTGLDIKGGAVMATYVFCDSYCWLDGYTGPDPSITGMNIQGNDGDKGVAQVTYTGTIISSGTGITMNANTGTVHVSGSYLTGAYAADSFSYPVKFQDGGMWLTNSRLTAVRDTEALYVGPNANLLTLTATDFLNGATFASDPGSDMCPRINNNGAIGPCPWTPGIAFGGASTGVTYDPLTTGYWGQLPSGLVYMNGRVKLTSKGSAVGSATITNLPKQGTFQVAGTCQMAVHSNITSVTGWEMNIPGLSSTANINGFSGPYTNTNFANNSEMFFACTILGQ